MTENKPSPIGPVSNGKKIESIPYLEIIKNSFRLAWKNKLLWWFGFLVSLGSSGSFNFNLPVGKNEDLSDEELNNFFQSAEKLFQQYLPWIISGIILLMILLIFFYIISKISRGSLIKGIEKISKGEKTGFKIEWKEGKKYFWKILGLDIILSFSFVLISLVLMAPSIFLFISKAYIPGIILIIASVLFIIILAILVSFLRNFGHIYIIIGNLSTWNAIEKAYDLFRKNIWSSIIMSLILSAVGIGIGLIFIFAIFAYILIMILLGFLLWLIVKMTGVIILGIIAFLALLIFIIILRSFLEVFYQANWIMFFKEIASQPKIQEVIINPVLEVKIETKPSESVNLTGN